jgi:ERCC4-related helicase
MIKNFEPRLYQQTMLATCVSKNCLVVLPTGMGKTAVAVMLASQRLSQYPKSKILVLAPTKPLVEQIMQVFRQTLDIPEEKIIMFTGNVTPEKRKEMWKDTSVIISTPQGLENDIISSKIGVEDVSLLVFDEAHRAVGDYSYVFIAKQYHKKAEFPRLLAMTASPGSEIEKIIEVCKNLYIEDIEVRTEDDPDVKPYIQDVTLDWITVDLPEDFKVIQAFITNCYRSKLKELKENGIISSTQPMDKTSLLQLQGQLHAEISQGNKDWENLKAVSLLAEAMKVQHALELLETQGISALNTYFEKLEMQARTTSVKAVKNLVVDLNFRSALVKTRALYEKNIEHPKLAELKKLVKNETEKNPQCKIIVFNQYRDSASKIVDELANEGITAKLFIGQQKKEGVGLSQKKQIEMLNEFREGKFNVLISTSIAEEGLDIPQVNIVIFYEPIPSAIRTIQRKGRTGRLEKGRVIILMTKHTRDEGYRWSAHHKERRMFSNLKNLKEKMYGHLNERKTQSDLTKFTAPADTGIKIIIDYREKGSRVIKELVEHNVKVDLQKLNVGDFLLSSRVGVEFKTKQDFVDSIIDGRLLSQAASIKDAYERPLIIIEGEEDIYSMRKVHPNAIRGALAAITVDFGIPIIYTQNYRETAGILEIIAKREKETSGSDFSAHGEKKPMSIKEQQEYIISALPGVGTALAKPLLEKFGSVKAVINADESELKKVELIGDKKAKKIREILDKNYQML